jgi:CHAT domain-containing protein
MSNDMPDRDMDLLLASLRDTDRGVTQDCSDEVVWFEVAGGCVPDEVATVLLRHASVCPRCSRLLAQAIEDFSDERAAEPAFVTGKHLSRAVKRGIRQSRLSEWRRFQRRIWWHRPSATAAKWGSIAAGILLAPALAWFVMDMRTPAPEGLLAKAYYEQRTSELRLVDCRHSPVRFQRGGGSAFSKPESLLKAEASLAERIEARPEDPELLRLQAEAEMISGYANTAVQTLLKAVDFHPQDAHILADLGASYALRGDVERQPVDYPVALEYLSRSLQLEPRAPKVIFNRALVLERMLLKDQAVREWEHYLNLDSSSDWAKEVRQHLADLKAELKSRQDQLDRTVDDPDRFLAQAATGDVDAEAYLRDIAVTKWLPRANIDPRAREAAVELGRILKDRHRDSWLSDVVRDLDRRGMAEGFEQLAAARVGNEAGTDTKGALASLASAREAKQSFVRAGSSAGILWARFEEVHSLRILGRNNECWPAAEKLAADLDARRYIWALEQTRMEYVTCEMRVGRLSDAAATLQKVEHASRAAGFGDAALRADVGDLDMTSYVGLSSEVFAKADEDLRTFWSGAYPAVRLRQLLSYPQDLASRSGQNYAALFLERSAVWAVAATANPRLEANARGGLAAAAQAAGEQSEARENLKLADKLYANLRPQERTEPQAALAKVELDRGDANAALARLEPLRATFDPVNLPTAAALTQYYSVLGEAYRQKGLLPEATGAFRKSIQSRRVESLTSERERSGILKSIESSYRGLVAATLASSGNASEASGIWQSFRALDAAGSPAHPESGDVAILSYLDLPDGLIAWFSRKDQVTLRRFGASRAEVARTVRRFRRECSDAETSKRSLQEDARQLYEWMVEPFAAQFSEQDRDVIFELDGVLAGVPVQALTLPDGRYLADRFSVLVSSGYATTHQSRTPTGNASVLVVADPALTEHARTRFPQLPDTLREAMTIQKSFPNVTILKEEKATLDAVSAARPTADIFHFAGHGYPDENGALLFAPRDPKLSDYDLLRSADLLRQDWSRSRLVVLSACATAAGELQGPHNPESLVRAFTRAGVPRVAASLWNVDDAATAELMGAFYSSLSKGASPSEALRTAQGLVRHRTAWSHPYYWAGFQLFGTT